MKITRHSPPPVAPTFILEVSEAELEAIQAVLGSITVPEIVTHGRTRNGIRFSWDMARVIHKTVFDLYHSISQALS